MTKKKVIFMVINMNIGGTEKALLNMISEMPTDRYDITILMLEKSGGFLDSIPSHVHVECLDGYEKIKKWLKLPPFKLTKQLLLNGNGIKAFNLVLFHVLTKVLRDRSIFFRYLMRQISKPQNEYDIAVAYAGPMDFISFFVAHILKAKRKIQWIHFDVRKIGFNDRFAKRVYKTFTKIFVVSEEGKNILKSRLPVINNKIESFPNITSSDLIIKMSNKASGFFDNFSGIRILTVGRLSKEKGQDITIPILSRLRKEGYNVRWYCIGEGSARKNYENIIRHHNMGNEYILLGANANPYPFMKQCDIYVQPSRHEGYCITLAEAKCFDNPIVTTRFTGASEQITNEKTGLIVDFDEEQLYIAIKRLIDDEILRQTIRKNLQNKEAEQNNNMEKFYKAIGDFNERLIMGEKH